MAPKMRIPYLMNPVVDKAGTEGKSNNEVETSSSSRSKSGSRSSSASRSTPQRASNSGSGRQRRKFPEIYTCSDCKEKSHYGAAHLGGRSFHPCDECDRTYTTKAILKRHVKAVHEGERAYKCAECPASYDHFKNLAKHRRDAHFGR